MTNDELYEQYINGNFNRVKDYLKSLPPLGAACTTASLFENVLHDEGVLDNFPEDAYTLSKRLRAWSDG